MEKRQRFMRLHFLALFLLLCNSPEINAQVTWIGPATAPDVTNEDLIIDGSGGNIMLAAGATTILASTTTITVTVINANATVTGNDTAPSCLNFIATAGNQIIIDLTQNPYNLTFLGCSDVALDPLTIVSQGQVVVLLNGGRSFTLGSGGGYGPTQWWVFMQNTPSFDINFMRHDFFNGDQNEDLNIVIADGSILSYAAPTSSTDNANILWTPTNESSGTGRMILTVQNGGSVVIAGSTLVTGACDTIEPTIPSGGIASWTVTNNPSIIISPYTGLFIFNQNTIYPELLVDPFYTQGAIDDPPYIGTFNGLRYGFVLGAGGNLSIDTECYLWYEGQANNICPDIGCISGINCSVSSMSSTACGGCGLQTGSLIKKRNPSALIVDGYLAPGATPAAINLGVQAGIFFLSAVDVNGNISTLVSPANRTPGAGEIVFDVEGPLNVTGMNTGTLATTTLNSLMQILSLQENINGGPLFQEDTGTAFPVRTFATDVNGNYLAYNSACWMINNRVNYTSASIVHTDENHMVYQSNDSLSQPAYIGGEGWYLAQLLDISPTVSRPEIAFYNSIFHFCTSAAFTGFDLAVPDLVRDDVEFANLVEFRFYSNGRVIDNGTGRTCILGTIVGSQACDGCTIISCDAHLNVMQDTNFSSINPDVLPDQDEQLFFTVSSNTDLVTEAIDSTDITGQYSIHEVYLGCSSNISIGEYAPTCISQFTPLQSTPRVWIAGDFFNFNTHGGFIGIPDTSNVTGQGGIFVDLNGGFGIMPDYIASISAMVTKSCNGEVTLPKSQVVFTNRIGIADWKLALSAPSTVIIPSNAILSVYTLDWVATTKDFTDFTPYEIGNIQLCSCPAVVTANVTALPTIEGMVDQFIIVDSRIGDPAQIMIDGGYVKELLWLSNCRPGEAATAVVTLQNGGQLGMNTAHRNIDSINTQTTFGVNGVTLIANGNGRVDLNTDMIINNICAILQGPDWTSANTLEFRADAERFIVVTPDGTLDLSGFTAGGTIRFGENIRLVFEPGSRIILGNAITKITDNGSLEFESSPQLAQTILTLDASVGPIDNALNPLISYDITAAHPLFAPLNGYGDGLINTDPFRINIIGTGTIQLSNQATAFIGVGAVVGVETLFETLPDGTICQIPTSNVTLELVDASTFNIGIGDIDQGGVFQVGNTENFTGHTVNFTLAIDGDDAEFIGGSGAFVGLGAGVVRPSQQGEPQSAVLADVLFNVGTISLNFAEGNFSMNRIFSTNTETAQSLVIGNATSFNLVFPATIFPDSQANLRSNNVSVQGGGNLYLINPATDTNEGAVYLANLSTLNPTNADADNIISIPFDGGTVPDARLQPGLLASTDMLDNVIATGLTPSELFETIKALSATVVFSRCLGLSTIAPLDVGIFRESRTTGLLGYVDRGFIGRQDIFDIIDTMGGDQGDRRARAYDNGDVTVQIDSVTTPPPAPVLFAVQIQE